MRRCSERKITLTWRPYAIIQILLLYSLYNQGLKRDLVDSGEILRSGVGVQCREKNELEISHMVLWAPVDFSTGQIITSCDELTCAAALWRFSQLISTRCKQIFNELSWLISPPRHCKKLDLMSESNHQSGLKYKFISAILDNSRRLTKT